jgi:hypothetical protein
LKLTPRRQLIFRRYLTTGDVLVCAIKRRNKK